MSLRSGGIDGVKDVGLESPADEVVGGVSRGDGDGAAIRRGEDGEVEAVEEGGAADGVAGAELEAEGEVGVRVDVDVKGGTNDGSAGVEVEDDNKGVIVAALAGGAGEVGGVARQGVGRLQLVGAAEVEVAALIVADEELGAAEGGTITGDPVEDEFARQGARDVAAGIMARVGESARDDEVPQPGGGVHLALDGELEVADGDPGGVEVDLVAEVGGGVDEGGAVDDDRELDPGGLLAGGAGDDETCRKRHCVKCMW